MVVKKIAYTLFLSCSWAQIIFPALDITFGLSGIVSQQIGINDYITTVTLNTSGTIYGAGVVNTMKKTKIGVIRYTSLGVLDTAFGGTGYATTLIGSRSEATSMALQSDGKVLVGGFAIQDQTSFALVRYTTSGALDTTFNSTGIVTTSIGVGCSMSSVKPLSSGKILVGGTAVVGTAQFALARYNSNGSLDTTFGSSGIVLTQIGEMAALSSILIQSDGKIVAIGTVCDGGSYYSVIVRYNSEGSLDANFGTGGIATTVFGMLFTPQSAALQSDGKIVIAGTTTDATGTGFGVVRYTSAGALDTTFNTTGCIKTFRQDEEEAYAVAIQSSGKIVVAGNSTGDSAKQFAMVRYTTDGAIDTSFASEGYQLTTINGSGSLSSINALALQADSKIIAGGYSNGTFTLARYTAS